MTMMFDGAQVPPRREPSYMTFVFKNYPIFIPRSYVEELEEAVEEAIDHTRELEREGSADFTRQAHEMSTKYLSVWEQYGREKADRIEAERERDYYKTKYQSFKDQEARKNDINTTEEVASYKFASKSGLTADQNAEVAYCMYVAGVDLDHIAELLHVKADTIRKYVSRAEKVACEVQAGNNTSLSFCWPKRK